MNVVALGGNLVKDAELKVLEGTGGEFSVLEFTIAWTARRVKQDGQIDERAQFIDCVVYNDHGYAEGLDKSGYMKKGKRVGVEAKLKYDSWKGDDGASRSKIRLDVKHVDFLTPKSDDQEPTDDE